jgi:hypothetical protein
MKADYAWQELYEAAVLETDDGKLAKCLPVVKAGIDARLQELQMEHQGRREERRAISAALIGLDVLRRERTLSRNGFEQGLNTAEQPFEVRLRHHRSNARS